MRLLLKVLIFPRGRWATLLKTNPSREKFACGETLKTFFDHKPDSHNAESPERAKTTHRNFPPASHSRRMTPHLGTQGTTTADPARRFQQTRRRIRLRSNAHCVVGCARSHQNTRPSPHPRDEAEHLVPLRPADQRAHTRARGLLVVPPHGTTHRDAGRAFQYLFHHLVVDLIVQQQARCGAADTNRASKAYNSGFTFD